jgi:hypothetical protein
MAPEGIAAGALHDAVVGIGAVAVEDRGDARASAFKLGRTRVQHLKRLAHQQFARGAKHFAQVTVAVHHGAVA